MDKVQHGLRLKAAMAAQRLGREDIATAADVKVRTVTNWTSGATMPSDRERAVLRRVLGDYDNPGDPVEVALRGSELHEWRQDAVLSTYKRHLHEQREERVG
jgi:transcriptional regulator with XRE-family HTH domain